MIFHLGQLIFLSLARTDQWPKILNGKTALYAMIWSSEGEVDKESKRFYFYSVRALMPGAILAYSFTSEKFHGLVTKSCSLIAGSLESAN